MKIRSFLGLLVVAALLLSACGGDDGGNNNAAATSVPTLAVVDTPAPLETPTAAETPTVAETPTTVSETSPITGTEEMTGTETMTDTGTGAGMTETTPLTDTEGITGTDNLTGTTGGSAGLATTRGVIRASELLDYNVENGQNEDLGSVEDAVVSLQDSCINYLVLSFGGVLGLGENQYLIPWRAVSVQPQEERLLLNIEPGALNDAPTFDVDNLPDMTLPDWDADINTYWENIDLIPTATASAQTGTTSAMTDTNNVTGTTATATETMTGTENMTGTMAGGAAQLGAPCGMMSMSENSATTTGSTASAGQAVTDTGTIEVEPLLAMRLSELLDYNVRNPQGEDLGTIEDMMVDWRADRLAYAILSFGGFLGLGDKWFILPLDALSLNTAEQQFVFAADPDRLQDAPGFDANNLPDTADLTWDEQIRQYWQENR